MDFFSYDPVAPSSRYYLETGGA